MTFRFKYGFVLDDLPEGATGAPESICEEMILYEDVLRMMKEKLADATSDDASPEHGD